MFVKSVLIMALQKKNLTSLQLYLNGLLSFGGMGVGSKTGTLPFHPRLFFFFFSMEGRRLMSSGTGHITFWGGGGEGGWGKFESITAKTLTLRVLQPLHLQFNRRFSDSR